MATYTELDSSISFFEAVKMNALLDYKNDLEKIQQEESEPKGDKNGS